MFDINRIVYILNILYMYYMYHVLYNHLILHSTIFYIFINSHITYDTSITYVMYYTHIALFNKKNNLHSFFISLHPDGQPVFSHFLYNISNTHVVYFLFVLYITYYTYLYFSNRTGTMLSHDPYNLYFILLQDDHYDQISLFFSKTYNICMMFMMFIMYIIHM